MVRSHYYNDIPAMLTINGMVLAKIYEIIKGNYPLMSTEQADCPRLIEVALPIRELSAESVRDKNIHQAHISLLHQWWARRPLAAARAVVFASLVPDPDNSSCPKTFIQAVERLLRDEVPSELKYYYRGRKVVRDPDPYRPYVGMDDTLRNRLLMFIARWSPEHIDYQQGRIDTEPKSPLLLDDRSLVKWETSAPNNAQGNEVLKLAQQLVRIAHDGKIPTVLDPFAGGGAIPLEVGRLGSQAIANDYNPVAYLVERATCEFPQKYGKPSTRTIKDATFGEREDSVPNALVFDVQKWSSVILKRTFDQVGYLYPSGADHLPVTGYLWARTVPCSNPSCRASVPLLRSLLVASKDNKKVALGMVLNDDTKEIRFTIVEGTSIERTDGTKSARGPVICPFCKQPTSEAALRVAGREGTMGERMVAVMVEGAAGKAYRPVELSDLEAFGQANILAQAVERPNEYIVPEINSPTASPNAGAHRSINLELYGFTKWGQLFNSRQLVVLQNLIGNFNQTLLDIRADVADRAYADAISTYLALWIDRIAAFGNTMTRWRASHEKSETPFSGQSIPMMWDFPEVNPFADVSGSASTQLHYLLKVVERESWRTKEFVPPQIILGSATSMPLNDSACDYVVTDPPYGNSIAYADLSDFFYVWLKRSLGEVFPEVFTLPQTPKNQEATSHKHRHEGSQHRANKHYEQILTESFRECGRVTKKPKLISVMFAHQTTEAWTALLSALFNAGLAPCATWPIATEMQHTALALGTASLETSVTVVCHPREIGNAASYRDVRREIEQVVRDSVKRFWSYGFRGADLIVACYGPAVGVFGKYERVEKADGTPVGVPELLEFARIAARDAIAGEFRGDNLSTLYYVWTNLYGTSEQAWDDARLVVQIGGDAENAMAIARGHGIFVVNGAKCRLALLADRADRPSLGSDPNPPLIDALHRAMLYWKQEKRVDLVYYLAGRDLLEDGPLWNLAQALFEVLPRDMEDWKLVSALLGERETLRTEAKRGVFAPTGPQPDLELT